MCARRIQSCDRIDETLPSVRAARAVITRGVSLGVAAAEFGITRPGVHFQLRRIMRIEQLAPIVTTLRYAPGPKPGGVRELVRGVAATIAPVAKRVWNRQPAPARTITAKAPIVTAVPPLPAKLERKPAIRAPSRVELAEVAARSAHDTPSTRFRAARQFGVPLEAVIAAWERLYPNEHRHQVG